MAFRSRKVSGEASVLAADKLGLAPGPERLEGLPPVPAARRPPAGSRSVYQASLYQAPRAGRVLGAAGRQSQRGARRSPGRGGAQRQRKKYTAPDREWNP